MHPSRRDLLGAGLLGSLGWSGTTTTAAAEAAATGLVRRVLAFPRDHGAHPGQHIEWWYLTGWLAAPGSVPTPATGDGELAPAFGFQLTFFRSRGPAPDEHPSRFAASQVFMAHAALTVLPAGAISSGLTPGRLSHDQRIARGGFGLAGADEADTDVQLGAGPRAWRLRRQARGGGLSIYQADFKLARVAAGAAAGEPRSPTDAAETQQGSARSQAVQLTLRLSASQAPLLQGEAGWSRKGPQPDQASFYVSEPQLQVQAGLETAGRRLNLPGRAWLDHEWSDQLLPSQAAGWDWLGINLFDGSALTLFRLRRQVSDVADATAPLWAGGSWRSASGESRSLAPGEITMLPLRHWRSPASGATYPVAWTVSTAVGRFELGALLDAQELDARSSSATIYWEGLAELIDPASRRRIGLGYLELTGYAGRPRL